MVIGPGMIIELNLVILENRFPFCTVIKQRKLFYCQNIKIGSKNQVEIDF